MKLPEQDAKLYFDLMWSLQSFVNNKLELIPAVQTLQEYENLPSEDKLKIRDAVFENPAVIDEFVQLNPSQLSEDHLIVVGQWKNFVKGKFYIERYLKKYAILIGEDNVYGVLGQYSSLEEMIHKSHLPMYIEAVLLPFKGHIIYDGLFQSYRMYFGRGIKTDLKEQYMRAKQRNEIITSFEENVQVQKAAIQNTSTPDWKSELEELVKKAKKLRGGSGQPAINSSAFSLVKASLDLALVGVTDAEDSDTLYKEYKKVNRALKRVEDTIYRM